MYAPSFRIELGRRAGAAGASGRSRCSKPAPTTPVSHTSGALSGASRVGVANSRTMRTRPSTRSTMPSSPAQNRPTSTGYRPRSRWDRVLPERHCRRSMTSCPDSCRCHRRSMITGPGCWRCSTVSTRRRRSLARPPRGGPSSAFRRGALQPEVTLLAGDDERAVLQLRELLRLPRRERLARQPVGIRADARPCLSVGWAATTRRNHSRSRDARSPTPRTSGR